MWRQVAGAGLGLWLLAAPDLLGYDGLAADASWTIGPLVASFSFLAAFAITRSLRWANVPLGTALALSAVVSVDTIATVHGVVIGTAFVVLALGTPPARAQDAGGWGAVLRQSRASES